MRQAQTKAMLSVNRELIQLYWDIGRLIVERQDVEGWGQSVLERLADDLQEGLPGVAGFSRSNVFRMRAFFLAYRPAEIPAQPVPKPAAKKVAQPVRQPSEEVPPEPVAQLPWENLLTCQEIGDRIR